MLKKSSFGLTSPLITLASGAKMGKTEKGAIWLNENLFSAYDYWQFWRNTDDRDVIRWELVIWEMTFVWCERLASNDRVPNLRMIHLVAKFADNLWLEHSFFSLVQQKAKQAAQNGAKAILKLHFNISNTPVFFRWNWIFGKTLVLSKLKKQNF